MQAPPRGGLRKQQEGVSAVQAGLLGEYSSLIQSWGMGETHSKDSNKHNVDEALEDTEEHFTQP